MTITPRDLGELKDEIEKARERFCLEDDMQIVSCYEAGRDGFWIHRYLTDRGIENLVVDSSSIEVNRRSRRAKTDRLDLRSLVDPLLWRRTWFMECGSGTERGRRGCTKASQGTGAIKEREDIT